MQEEVTSTDMNGLLISKSIKSTPIKLFGPISNYFYASTSENIRFAGALNALCVIHLSARIPFYFVSFHFYVLFKIQFA